MCRVRAHLSRRMKEPIIPVRDDASDDDYESAERHKGVFRVAPALAATATSRHRALHVCHDIWDTHTFSSLTGRDPKNQSREYHSSTNHPTTKQNVRKNRLGLFVESAPFEPPYYPSSFSDERNIGSIIIHQLKELFFG